MTATDVLGAISIALSSAAIVHFLSRKKNKAEVANIETQVLERAIGYLNKEAENLRCQVEMNEKTIRQLQKQQEDCDEKARVSNIEVAILKRWIVTKKIETDEIRIFVMDDDDYVRHSFKERFERISVTKVHLFESVDELEDWIDIKPEVLILDYYIDYKTIDGLMHRILNMEDYVPKIIVISGMYKMQADKLPFKDRVMFVSKNEDFVNISVNAVMSFIESGLK